MLKSMYFSKPNRQLGCTELHCYSNHFVEDLLYFNSTRYAVLIDSNALQYPLPHIIRLLQTLIMDNHDSHNLLPAHYLGKRNY